LHAALMASHRDFVDAAWAAGKRLGVTFLVSLMAMDNAEREAYLKTLADKSPQFKRLCSLYTGAMIAMKAEPETDGYYSPEHCPDCLLYKSDCTCTPEGNC